MPRCPACRHAVPAALPACPRCAASLLAPGLASGVPDHPPGTLAPVLSPAERLPPGADLAAAIAAAPDGGALALGEGTYRLARGVAIGKALALSGLGPGRTRIVCAGPDFVLLVHGAGLLRAQGLAIAHEGRSPADVLVVDDAEADLTDVWLSGGHAEGFPKEPAGGRHGRGLVLQAAATAMARRCRFERNGRDGVAVLDEATAHLDGWLCRQNQGLGVLVAGRGHATLADGEADTNFLGGVALRDEARGVLRGCTCRRGGGFGVALLHAAQAAIAACALVDNARSGLAYWHHAGGAATGVRAEGNREHGIEVRDDAAPELDGCHVVGNRAAGVIWSDRARGGITGGNVSENGQGDMVVLDDAAPVR